MGKGAILPYFDADDDWHERCVTAFTKIPLPPGTSGAVLAELFHLLSDNPRNVSAAWRFIRSDAIVVLPITTNDLPRLEELMRKYMDRPMDFADATLVLLAERESVTTVFSIENNDFETYRILGRKRFAVVPGRDQKDI